MIRLEVENSFLNGAKARLQFYNEDNLPLLQKLLRGFALSLLFCGWNDLGRGHQSQFLKICFGDCILTYGFFYERTVVKV